MALPVDLRKRLGTPIAAADLKDGRYAVTFKRYNSSKQPRYWVSIVTTRGMGALLAELPQAAREAVLG